MIHTLIHTLIHVVLPLAVAFASGFGASGTRRRRRARDHWRVRTAASETRQRYKEPRTYLLVCAYKRGEPEQRIAKLDPSSDSFTDDLLAAEAKAHEVVAALNSSQAHLAASPR